MDELTLSDTESLQARCLQREMDKIGLSGLSEAQCLEFEDVIAKLIALPEERLRAFKAGLAKLKSWLPIWEAIQEGPPTLKQKQKAISKLRKGLALLDGLAPKPKPVALAKPKFDEFLREMGLTKYAGFDGVRLRRDVPIEGLCLSDLIALELTRTQERGVREEFAKRFPRSGAPRAPEELEAGGACPSWSETSIDRHGFTEPLRQGILQQVLTNPHSRR